MIELLIFKPKPFLLKGGQPNMAQIETDLKDHTNEYLNITIDHENLDFSKAQEIAKVKALDRCDNPMILSWKNGITGDYYPKYKCGDNSKPFWISYAEGRGANLIVDFNKGEYVFMILKI